MADLTDDEIKEMIRAAVYDASVTALRYCRHPISEKEIDRSSAIADISNRIAAHAVEKMVTYRVIANKPSVA